MANNTPQDSLDHIRQLMRDFSRDRDWEQFHDPKSLLLALVGEIGELAELFQWLPADQAKGLASKPELHQRVGEEIGDIVLYLVRLADVLDVNLGQATMSKFDSVVERFPTDSVKGQAPRKS
ncbi:MAG: nucleotide pyrophosphohydrolase [Candidatus Nanopelagicales bacterium]